jgi:DNA polymerase-4
MMPASRKIIHIDMDAFYAAVEQRDFPAYRGKPVIVGGQPNSRGVVATCSYEARAYGVRSAMASSRAYRLCPQAIFVAPRFAAYQEASRQIHAILRPYTALIEPLSLDEAYLDVTATCSNGLTATQIAREIRQKICDSIGLTASAGVSYNKFLAKIASDINKPDGLTVITPAQGPAFAEQLPVGKFFGVGKTTEARLHQLDLYTGADLKQCDPQRLRQALGSSAEFLQKLACGLDDRPVIAERARKSYSVETTFEHDLLGVASLQAALRGIAEELASGLARHTLWGSTVTLKIKFSDFVLTTRSLTFARPLQTFAHLYDAAQQLLQRSGAQHRPVRLLGLGVSNLCNNAPETRQTTLFD